MKKGRSENDEKMTKEKKERKNGKKKNTFKSFTLGEGIPIIITPLA